MSNLTNTTKYSIRVLDGNIPDTEGYYIVSYEGTVVAAKSDLNLRSESKELVFGDNVTIDARNALVLSCKPKHVIAQAVLRSRLFFIY